MERSKVNTKGQRSNDIFHIWTILPYMVPQRSKVNSKVKGHLPYMDYSSLFGSQGSKVTFGSEPLRHYTTCSHFICCARFPYVSQVPLVSRPPAFGEISGAQKVDLYSGKYGKRQLGQVIDIRHNFYNSSDI